MSHPSLLAMFRVSLIAIAVVTVLLGFIAVSAICAWSTYPDHRCANEAVFYDNNVSTLQMVIEH